MSRPIRFSRQSSQGIPADGTSKRHAVRCVQRHDSCSDDRTIKLWDVNSKELITTLAGHKDRVRAIQFSSDGEFIISASEDNRVIIWDIQQNSVIKKFTLMKQKDYPLKDLILR